ncbi:MAG: hypothetical protein JJU19_17400 [Pararhodobacter sp.]|nr:hypothetical protein [Pararhodobacter sp.]
MTEHKSTWDYSNPVTGETMPAPFFCEPGIFAQEREPVALNDSNQKGLHAHGFYSGRYLIDPGHPHESKHLVHHFHKFCYQAISK